LSVDPLFVEPLTVTSEPTVSGNFRLISGSPAINAGASGYDFSDYPTIEGVVVDLDGTERVKVDKLDMGAYEWSSHGGDRLYVDADASGENDGSTWENALNSFANALNTAHIVAESATPVDEIFVASGIYKPTPGTDRSASFNLISGI